MYPGIDLGFLFEPFYVGKGSAGRCKNHLWAVKKNKHYNRIMTGKIRHILNDKKEPIIVIVKNDLIEKDAYHFEETFISIIGRIDKKTGPLANLSDGGIGGTKGYVPTERARQKISLRTIRMWKEWTEDVKKEIARRHSEMMKLNNPMQGKKHSQKFLNFMSVIMSGANNAFYGKKHTEKSKAIMAQKALGGKRHSRTYKFISPEGKEFIVTGGFNSFIKEHGLNHRIRKVMNTTNTYHGWRIEKIK